MFERGPGATPAPVVFPIVGDGVQLPRCRARDEALSAAPTPDRAEPR